MKSKRFLLRYEGPIEEFVGTVNAVKVIFYSIKVKGEVHKIGEVYDQNAFNFILSDMHITPYVPCITALKQLNKIQAARDKRLRDIAIQERISGMRSDMSRKDTAIVEKGREIEALKLKIFALGSEIKEIKAEIPKLEAGIKSLTPREK